MEHGHPDSSPRTQVAPCGLLVEMELKFCHENQSNGKVGQAEPPNSMCFLSR